VKLSPMLPIVNHGKEVAASALELWLPYLQPTGGAMRLAVFVIVLAGVAGCADSPPPNRCAGLDQNACQRRLINDAMQSAALAGHDPLQTYISLTTLACTRGSLTDEAECDRVAALRAEQNQTSITVRPGS
jgi:hypothetical protein